MAAPSRPRWGTLQFWPRKRSSKQIPSVNWVPIYSTKEQGLLGFLSYKVGMASVSVKDNTSDSMTKSKKIIMPVTILEVPNMKVFSVRFHKNKQVIKEIVTSNDKELKKIVKVPKSLGNLDKVPSEYDDVTIIAYAKVWETTIKKTPDLVEIGINAANAPAKLEVVKSLINKEISLKDFLGKKELLDTRAITKGKGLTGPLHRMGLSKKQHKSEKGVRRPGSLGPWHPAHVTFRVPQAGQLGMFSRVVYNNKVIFSSSIKEKDINPKQGFKHFGNIKGNYLLLKGSIQGPVKRAVFLTNSFRPTNDAAKSKFEFLEVVR